MTYFFVVVAIVCFVAIIIFLVKNLVKNLKNPSETYYRDDCVSPSNNGCSDKARQDGDDCYTQNCKNIDAHYAAGYKHKQACSENCNNIWQTENDQCWADYRACLAAPTTPPPTIPPSWNQPIGWNPKQPDGPLSSASKKGPSTWAKF